MKAHELFLHHLKTYFDLSPPEVFLKTLFATSFIRVLQALGNILFRRCIPANYFAMLAEGWQELAKGIIPSAKRHLENEVLYDWTFILACIWVPGSMIKSVNSWMKRRTEGEKTNESEKKPSTEKKFAGHRKNKKHRLKLTGHTETDKDASRNTRTVDESSLDATHSVSEERRQLMELMLIAMTEIIEFQEQLREFEFTKTGHREDSEESASEE